MHGSGNEMFVEEHGLLGGPVSTSMLMSQSVATSNWNPSGCSLHLYGDVMRHKPFQNIVNIMVACFDFAAGLGEFRQVRSC